MLLFVIGAAIAGRPPDFSASARTIVDYLDEDRTRIQVSSALQVLAVPALVWFLAAVSSRTPVDTPSRATANVALVAGAVAGGVFLTDVAALLVAALRPENMAESPELAQALYDYSWVAPAASAPLFAAMLASLGTLGLREPVLWPRWLGWAGLAAGAAYLLRTGGVFTDEGPFSPDGVLGFYVPIVALLGWVLLASLLLWRRPA